MNKIRLCALGNSYIGAIKEGWNQLRDDYPEIQVDFFASRRDGLRELRLSGRKLEPSTPRLSKDIEYTSGGIEQIDLDSYDIFLVYGLQILLPQLDRRLSASVKRQTLRDILDESLNIKICRLIRSISAAPVYVGHNPQKAKPVSRKHPENLLSYDEVINLMAQEISVGATKIIRQAPETLSNGWNTKVELSRGSTSLDVGDMFSNKQHPDEDFGHMNGEFGKIYLKKFFELLSTPSREKIE